MAWDIYREGHRLHVIEAGSLKADCVAVQADWIAELDPDSTGQTEEDTERHARLIAAAPDLLAMLKRKARMLRSYAAHCREYELHATAAAFELSACEIETTIRQAEED